MRFPRATLVLMPLHAARTSDFMPFNLTQRSVGGEAFGRRGRPPRAVAGGTVKHLGGGERAGGWRQDADEACRDV